MAWEDTHGFKSFGRVCDEIYDNAQPEKFTTIAEFNDLVSKESKYLYLDKLPNGELSLEKRLNMNENRYFINSDNVFQIGQTVYKVLEKGVASTKAENAHKLQNINNENLYSFLNQSEFELTNGVMGSRLGKVLKDAQYDCGNTASRTESSGNDQTRMKIQCGVDWNLSSQWVQPYSKYTIGAYKRGSFFLPWILVKRHISMDMKTRVDFKVNDSFGGYTWKTAILVDHGNDIFVDQHINTIKGDQVYGIKTDECHYGGYDCWGDTPSAPTVNLECNITIL